MANFIECLRHRVKGGDTKLKNHLKTCSENVSDISQISENDLICCDGKFTKDAFIKEIKKKNFQTFVLRIVDRVGEIRK